MHRVVARLAVGLAMLMLIATVAGAARAAGGNVVISQVYGGGGNSGATLKNDFIELYNPGSSTVDVSTWSVQYASSTGVSWAVTPLSGSIPPGGRYLIQEAAGAGGTVSLQSPDATGNIAMSATSGKVVLVRNQTSFTGSGEAACPATNVVDLVGYGSAANCAEGPPTATLSNTTAASRDAAGTDTNNNAADFTVVAPHPRTVGDTAPGVASTNPANNAADVSPSTNLTVTFNEPVQLDSVWFTISCSVTGNHTATLLPGSSTTTFTLDPDNDFAFGESCLTTITATAVHDLDSNDPPDTMAANFNWTITTTTPPVSIHEIQGSQQFSPYDGKAVSGVLGVVTAVKSNGFFMQDPNPDADPGTSDGIFVFTSSAPTAHVGDSVKVAGRVSEFITSTRPKDLPETEIVSPTVVTLSTGNPLPAPILIGAGGLQPPTASVVDGIAFDEPLEGMLVQLDNLQAVSPTNSFGEIWVVPNFGANAGVLTPRGGLLLQADDANPEKFMIDDDVVGPMPNVNVGARAAGSYVGVMDYGFSDYRIHVTTIPAFTPSPITREVTDQVGGGDRLTVATFNLENLAPQNAQSKFDALASELVNNLRSPDIVAFEEVQDNSGATDNGVVDSTETLAKFNAAIQAQGGPAYDFAWVNPQDGEDGGQPGGNIRVVFAWRKDVAGLSLAPGAAGGTHDANAVVGTGAATTLQYNPGRIDPDSTAWEDSRKPIAAKFLYNGHAVFAIANHFVSKGGDDPLWGTVQPPVQSSAVQRHEQAHEVASFVSQLLAANPSANVITLGDLNDFQFSETIEILKAAGLHDAIEELPLPERYSYVFGGNSQALDHMLIGGGLLNRPHTYDPVHVNAEFWDQASDHDPEVIGITLAAPAVSAQAASVDEGGSTPLSATGSDASGGPVSLAWDLDNDGTYETTGAAVFSAAALDGPSTRTVGVRATAPDGATATTTAVVTIRNVAPTATFASPTAAVLAPNTFTLSLSNATDPSAADRAAGFTYAFDCGTGLGEFGTAATATCATTDTGSLTVRGAVKDKDGGVTTYTATVGVTVTVDSLCTAIAGWAKTAGLANSLCVKLQNGQLGAFANEVDAQTGKALTADQAALLKRLAGRL